MSNKKGTEVAERIRYQEEKDYYIASRCLRDIFSGMEIEIKESEPYASVDLICSGIDKNSGKKVRFNVEVKERNKSRYLIKRYPDVQLRVDKYKRMREYSGKGVKLYYMVLLNQSECYLFDLDKIDFSNIKTNTSYLRVTQEDKNSKMKTYVLYNIPYRLAKYKIRCGKYFQEWCNN